MLLESLEFFKFGLIGGSFFALSVSFVSPFLVLKKNVLSPHAISHMILLGIFLSFLLGMGNYFFSLLITLGIVGIGLFVIILLKNKGAYEDSAISVVAHLFLALSFIIASKLNYYNSTLLGYLVGELALVTSQDAIFAGFIFLLTLLVFFKFHKFWLIELIDGEFPGINLRVSSAIYLILFILQIMIGIKIMGLLLVSSFYVFSALMSLKLCRNYTQTICLTGILNLLAIGGGFLLSLYFNFPFSSGTVFFLSLFLFPFLIKKSL